jgi:hypothetical protein
MENRNIRTLTLGLLLLLVFSTATLAQERRLTPQSRVAIAAAQSHPIQEIKVYTSRSTGRQRVEMISPYTPNVYNTPTPRPGESGEQHMLRLQAAANQMAAGARGAARAAGVTRSPVQVPWSPSPPASRPLPPVPPPQQYRAAPTTGAWSTPYASAQRAQTAPASPQRQYTQQTPSPRRPSRTERLLTFSLLLLALSQNR